MAVKLRRKSRTSTDFLITKIIIFTLFALYAFTLIFAMLWAFSASLKSQKEFYDNVNGLPREWLFSNYGTAFKQVSANGHNMFEMFWNSVWYSCGGALLGVLTSAVTSYVVAKYKFPGRGFIYGVAIVTMMIPIVGSFPSQYKVYTALHIIDTPFLLITKAAGFGFNFMVLYSFFRTLSWTYAEAGFIDGASHFKVFTRIMLPQALPVMGSLFMVRGNRRGTVAYTTFPTHGTGIKHRSRVLLEKKNT